MRRFLEELAESGEVPVPAWATAAEAERAEIDDLLVAADAAARLDAPGEAPPFDAGAARWAARMLFRACCCLADRTVGATTVGSALRESGPDASTASACWSVDLYLRHLPALHGLARGLAPGDPLLAEMETIGAAWPLSSTGMPFGANVPVPPSCVAADPCLRRLHVDRVLSHGDKVRLAVPWVAEGVRAALGAHADLAPALAGAVVTPGGVSRDG